MKAPMLLAAAIVALSAGPVLAQVSIDADKDGRISLAEFRTARSGLIMGADSDKDGKVSQAELGALADARAPAGGAGQGAQRVFRILDADHDGFLSPSEVDAAVERRFRTLDANGDGYLSTAERQNWKTPG